MKNTLFLIACFIAAFTFKSHCQLTSGIAAYWKLDETSGNVTDAAGSNTGTVNGATQNQTGKIGKSYSFDGINDYVSIPNSTSLNIQGNTITLSAWVYPTANKHSVIVSKIHNPGTHVNPYFQYTLQFYYMATPMPRIYPRFGLSIGGTFKVVANTSLSVSLNEWHHIVGVYNGSTMKLYMDGSEVASTAQTGNINGYNTPVYISEIGSLDGSEVFHGRIDEIGIWNRAFTASEVTQLYNSGTGLSYPFGGSAYTLATSVVPAGSGTISLSPSGGSYAPGTVVSATASANSGYTFTGWSGDLTGSTNPGNVTMNSNKTITAIFTASSGGSDNLGNHTATQNIKLGNYWLSGDGGNEGIRVDAGGKVGIKTSSPTSELTVNGKILAKEVEVVSAISSDYVFEPDYQLMPLTDLELYIKQNKHLPEIPSAEEFSKTGQNLAKTDDMLLRKIEELTLYILSQEKKLIELNIAIESLNKEIKILKQNKNE